MYFMRHPRVQVRHCVRSGRSIEQQPLGRAPATNVEERSNGSADRFVREGKLLAPEQSNALTVRGRLSAPTPRRTECRYGAATCTRSLRCFRFATIVNVMITSSDQELHLPTCTVVHAPS